jgi:hypothetical protein
MIRYTLMFAAMLTASLTNTTTFAEENLGTPEQRAACTPDAFRYAAPTFLILQASRPASSSENRI